MGRSCVCRHSLGSPWCMHCRGVWVKEFLLPTHAGRSLLPPLFKPYHGMCAPVRSREQLPFGPSRNLPYRYQGRTRHPRSHSTNDVSLSGSFPGGTSLVSLPSFQNTTTDTDTDTGCIGTVDTNSPPIVHTHGYSILSATRHSPHGATSSRRACVCVAGGYPYYYSFVEYGFERCDRMGQLLCGR